LRHNADSGSSLDAAWGERLAAAFTTAAFSGSLHSALGILVMNRGFPPHHAQAPQQAQNRLGGEMTGVKIFGDERQFSVRPFSLGIESVTVHLCVQ
jgi:hypothetical protein